MVTTNAINQATAAAGKVLQGAGVGVNNTFSTPTYPSASGTSRKILVSDGTNNVYSTETWAVPGTSGNLLTSDGTNWTSAAASGGVQTATITLTNAQIKALHATPIQAIAAPGANKCIVIVTSAAQLKYGGTTAFTAGAGQTVSLYYGTAPAICAPVSNAMLVSTASKFGVSSQVVAAINQAVGVIDNVAVNLYNPVATEITGDAANDTTISLQILYWIATVS